MKLSPFLLACSILLVPHVFVDASKKKTVKRPKQPKQLKQPKPPKPSKKQGQCLKSDYLEARAAAVKKEISGEYFICSYSSFFMMYINGTFVEYPFFAAENEAKNEPGMANISSVDSSPHTNLALFNIGYAHTLGPVYNNSVIEPDYIGKWDFVDEELVQVPANNQNGNFRVSKTRICSPYRGDGYPGGTLHCKLTSLYNDVNDLAKDFDTKDEEPRNTAVYSGISTYYLVPAEFDGCPCLAEEEQFDYDTKTMPARFEGVSDALPDFGWG